MSLDKANFARTVKEQQAGISPQMWPIICPDNGNLVLNHPYEISINPCDSIWLPATYDKSYGVNPAQSAVGISGYMVSPTVMGQNMVDLWTTAPAGAPWLSLAATFGLRFNSPNNPWLLWGLGNNFNTFNWGTTPTARDAVGTTMMMRSITGPISRLWIQYYSFAFSYTGNIPGMNQIVLMSMLGFSHVSIERRQPHYDGAGAILTSPPTRYESNISSGGYRVTDLDTADLLALGEKPSPGAK